MAAGDVLYQTYGMTASGSLPFRYLQNGDEFMKKLLIMLGIALFFGVLALIDTGIAKSYTIEVIDITPEYGVTDGKNPVSFTVRLMQGGEPIEGHDISVTRLNGGKMNSYKKTTDEQGLVSFEYYPFKTSKYIPLQDARLLLRDESNSIFIYVPAELEFTIKLVEPGD